MATMVGAALRQAPTDMCSPPQFPVAGTFPHYVNRFLDPAFAFALGWTFWFE